MLCASLGLCSGNVKAAGGTKNLQNCSALTGFDVELGKLVNDELSRTKVAGSKKRQFGAKTFLGNGAYSLKRKEALRAVGAQSVLKNDGVRKILTDLDSDKLREMSKNKERLSGLLCTLLWPSLSLSLVIPTHDAIKGIEMAMTFTRCVTDFKSMSSEDKKN